MTRDAKVAGAVVRRTLAREIFVALVPGADDQTWEDVARDAYDAADAFLILGGEKGPLGWRDTPTAESAARREPASEER